MITSAPGRSYTAEEFIRLPQPDDGSRQELVEGVIITMPPPGFYHGRCCIEIGNRLRKYLEDTKAGCLVCNDSGVILARNPDTVRGPDLAFSSHERLPPPPLDGYPTVAPELIVEVLSPHDVFTNVQRKVQEYLTAGVRLIWVIVPEDRSVAIFRLAKSTSVLANGELLDGEDVLPGFTCRVAELFPCP